MTAGQWVGPWSYTAGSFPAASANECLQRCCGTPSCVAVKYSDPHVDVWPAGMCDIRASRCCLWFRKIGAAGNYPLQSAAGAIMPMPPPTPPPEQPLVVPTAPTGTQVEGGAAALILGAANVRVRQVAVAANRTQLFQTQSGARLGTPGGAARHGHALALSTADVVFAATSVGLAAYSPATDRWALMEDGNWSLGGRPSGVVALPDEPYVAVAIRDANTTTMALVPMNGSMCYAARIATFALPAATLDAWGGSGLSAAANASGSGQLALDNRGYESMLYWTPVPTCVAAMNPQRGYDDTLTVLTNITFAGDCLADPRTATPTDGDALTTARFVSLEAVTLAPSADLATVVVFVTEASGRLARIAGGVVTTLRAAGSAHVTALRPLERPYGATTLYLYALVAESTADGSGSALRLLSTTDTGSGAVEVRNVSTEMPSGSADFAWMPDGTTVVFNGTFSATDGIRTACCLDPYEPTPAPLVLPGVCRPGTVPEVNITLTDPNATEAELVANISAYTGAPASSIHVRPLPPTSYGYPRYRWYSYYWLTYLRFYGAGGGSRSYYGWYGYSSGCCGGGDDPSRGDMNSAGTADGESASDDDDAALPNPAASSGDSDTDRHWPWTVPKTRVALVAMSTVMTAP